MAVLTRKKQEAVIVAQSNGTERLLKVTVVAIQGDNVTLDFDLGANESVHTAEAWECALTERKAALLKQNVDRPKERAAYS